MALRYAVATGLWSATATWDGGTLPAAADDVYANGKTVTVNQSITVSTLRNLAGGAAVAGGYFDLSSGLGQVVAITGGITADRDAASISGLPVLQISAPSGAVTVNAILTGATSSSRGIPVRFKSGCQCAITINGNLIGGQNSNNRLALDYNDQLSSNDRSPALTINGNIEGGTSLCPAMTVAWTSSIIVVNGYVHANGGIGIMGSDGNPQITINGDLVGGNSLARYGVQDSGLGDAARVSVNGKIIGGVGQDAYGLYMRRVVHRCRELVYSTTGTAPIGGGGSAFDAAPVAMRGTGFSFTLPSDDNWPLATGAPITLSQAVDCPDCPDIPWVSEGVLWPVGGRVRR